MDHEQSDQSAEYWDEHVSSSISCITSSEQSHQQEKQNLKKERRNQEAQIIELIIFLYLVLFVVEENVSLERDVFYFMNFLRYSNLSGKFSINHRLNARPSLCAEPIPN